MMYGMPLGMPLLFTGAVRWGELAICAGWWRSQCVAEARENL